MFYDKVILPFMKALPACVTIHFQTICVLQMIKTFLLQGYNRMILLRTEENTSSDAS